MSRHMDRWQRFTRRRQVLDLVFARDRGRCWICLGPVAREQASVDHVVPQSVRPDLAFQMSNLRLAHGACNAGRADRPASLTHHAVGW